MFRTLVKKYRLTVTYLATVGTMTLGASGVGNMTVSMAYLGGF
jgi:hypothetical protein